VLKQEAAWTSSLRGTPTAFGTISTTSAVASACGHRGGAIWLTNGICESTDHGRRLFGESKPVASNDTSGRASAECRWNSMSGDRAGARSIDGEWWMAWCRSCRIARSLISAVGWRLSSTEEGRWCGRCVSQTHRPQPCQTYHTSFEPVRRIARQLDAVARRVISCRQGTSLKMP